MSSLCLARFDETFLVTIKDYKKVHIKPQKGTFYTVKLDGKKAGVIGFSVKEGGNYFLKIGIHQDFRGSGLFNRALGLLVRKHQIEKIYSTLATTNAASIRAHIKLGFRRIPLRVEKRLRREGLLLKRNVRMVKSF
ncbi:hypothetical protein CL622_00800 [archaeon]|nr:hypothetical protein [archaeon]|tara:strand:- start:2805 stop:3212 length:408 start_codon:yes stop_codon:yes gene_type:complete